MENKKDRLLLESDVIAAVDKHINSYNRLDDDITCILEEVKEKAVMSLDDYKGGDGSYTLTIHPTSEVKKNKGIFRRVRDLLDEFEDAYRNADEVPDDKEFCFKLAHAFCGIDQFNLYKFSKWLTFLTIGGDLPSDETQDIIELLEEKYGVEE